MKPYTPRPKRRMQAARAWILGNPSASIPETMAATGISSTSVTKLRKELVAEGIFKPYSRTGGIPKKGVGDIAAPIQQFVNPDADPETEAILAGTLPMTRDERRKRLEFFVRHGQPDHSIRANAELTKMEREEGKKEEVGTGPPQSLDDAIGCASDIIEALCAWGGEKAVKKAVTLGMESFFREQKKKQEGDNDGAVRSGSTVVDSSLGESDGKDVTKEASVGS